MVSSQTEFSHLDGATEEDIFTRVKKQKNKKFIFYLEYITNLL